MKLPGMIGAILVIAGFIALSQPMLSAGDDVQMKRRHDPGHLEQYAGAAGILLGLGLVGLDISRRE